MEELKHFIRKFMVILYDRHNKTHKNEMSKQVSIYRFDSCKFLPISKSNKSSKNSKNIIDNIDIVTDNGKGCC